MGDPKFPKKTYSTPRHPWEKERIDSERELLNKFGLKNKRELWKNMELLKSFRSQARELQARMRTNDDNAVKQFQLLIKRLNRYSIISENATLDDVLSLTIEDILARRLQTIVYRKNYARTPKQARQLITHGHITMDGRRVTVPGIIVEGHMEGQIGYTESSPLNDELHPLRQIIMNGPAAQSSESGQENESQDETESGEEKQ
ncbi:MAG: 30S ribosomal protein S4 [Thermoplasmataceae archaeon]